MSAPRLLPQVLRLTGPGISGGPLLASLLARCAGLQELDLRGSAVSLDTWLAGVLEQHGAHLRVLRVSLARRARPATRRRKLRGHPHGKCRGGQRAQLRIMSSSQL